MSANRLLWLQDLPERCPGGSVPEDRDAVLQLEFKGRRALLRLSLGFCAADQTYLAELPLLAEALAEVDYTPADVLGFTVDGEPVEAAVSLGGDVGEVFWERYTTGTLAAAEWLEAPLPTAAEVRALPQVREAWTLAQEAGTYYQGEEGEATLGYVAILTTPDGLVRGVTLSGEPAGADALHDLIVKGCAAPPTDLPEVRPKVVLVADPFGAEELTAALADLGIRAKAGDVSSAAAALAALKEALEPDPIPSYFSAYPEGEVKAFFTAARAFFRAKPWEVVDGTKFLAFRLEDKPWHYANVMGQAGEEFGVATFGDWLEVCRTLNNPETILDMLASLAQEAEAPPKSLLAAGHAEGLSLSPLQALAPEDAAYLAQLRVKPSLRREYAAVHRYSVQGFTAPAFSPAVYTGLLSVLTERARKVKGDRVSSIKAKTATSAGELEVRYPAKGDEGSAQDSYYRFTIPFRLSAQSRESGGVLEAEVEAPGEAKWHRVMSAVIRVARAQPDIFPWPPNLKQGEYFVWLDQAPVKEPSPTVEQLAGLQGLTLAGYDHEDPLVFVSLPGPDTAEIKVKFSPA